MKLKRHINFINEDYNYSEEDNRFLDLLSDLIMKEFKEWNYDVVINYLSDHGMDIWKDIDITGYNTFMSLYFDDTHPIKPSKVEFNNIFKDVLVEYKIGIKEYDRTNATLFVVMFDIEKIMKSDFAKSLIGVDKFKL